MVPGTGITNPKQWSVGWVDDYLQAFGGNRFPWSFHILTALFVLGAAVGRRAVVRRGTYRLYPPINILLLGTSGVGKSQSLKLASTVLQGIERPGWHAGFGGFTMRGLMREWGELQRRDNTDILEGYHIEGEISNVITPRRGAETINAWLIQVAEQGSVQDFTGTHGKSSVRGVTIGFGFASTLSYLRGAISADEFAGGLMHRFFIAHEPAVQEREEERPDERRIRVLRERLLAIREQAPPEMGITDGATRRLNALRRQEKFFSNHHLAGWWNRYDGLVLHLGQLFALAQGRDTVDLDAVVRGDALLRDHLYPPLAAIVEQVAASREKKELYDLHESLVTAGPMGWPIAAFWRRLGKVSPRAQVEAMETMVSMGLAHRAGGRVYGRQEWLGQPFGLQPETEEPTSSGDLGQDSQSSSQ